MTKIIIGYLVIINLISLVMMAVDKSKAKYKKWRISEKILLIIAIIGGSVGVLLGIYVFRHKTRKLKFTLGVPIILLLQLLLLLYLTDSLASLVI